MRELRNKAVQEKDNFIRLSDDEKISYDNIFKSEDNREAEAEQQVKPDRVEKAGSADKKVKRVKKAVRTEKRDNFRSFAEDDNYGGAEDESEELDFSAGEAEPDDAGFYQEDAEAAITHENIAIAEGERNFDEALKKGDLREAYNNVEIINSSINSARNVIDDIEDRQRFVEQEMNDRASKRYIADLGKAPVRVRNTRKGQNRKSISTKNIKPSQNKEINLSDNPFYKSTEYVINEKIGALKNKADRSGDSDMSNVRNQTVELQKKMLQASMDAASSMEAEVEKKDEPMRVKISFRELEELLKVSSSRPKRQQRAAEKTFAEPQLS